MQQVHCQSQSSIDYCSYTIHMILERNMSSMMYIDDSQLYGIITYTVVEYYRHSIA